MKLLIVSDIHSNIWSIEAILRAEPGFDFFCCAGDIVDYGTAPREVVNTIRSMPSPKAVVRGNHDILLTDTYREKNYDQIDPGNYKWVHHNCRLLTESEIQYLETLPTHCTFSFDGWTYLLQHQYGEEYAAIVHSRQFDDHWKQHTSPDLWHESRRRMIFGHTHRQSVCQLETGMELIHPGSTSYRRPDDPDKTAHYAVIEDGTITLKRVDYDRKPLLAETERQHRLSIMKETELQDFYFFFGPARTARDPLPEKTDKK